METTEKLGLRKPSQDEYYNVDDFNHNADLIEEEFSKKATKDTLGRVKLTDSTAVTDSEGLALPATEKNATIEGTMAYQIDKLNTDLGNLNTITWIVEGGRYFNTASLLSFKGTNYVVHVLIHASLDGKTYRFYQRFQIGSSISTELVYYLPLPSFTYGGNQSYYAVVKMDNWVMSLDSVVLGNINKTADATVYIGLSVG